MILYLDCRGGVSGDMLAAALADLANSIGRDGRAVIDEALVALGVAPDDVAVLPVRRKGMAALGLSVADKPGFGTFAELRAALGAASLAEGAVTMARGAATRMAAAESAVHGTDEPHMHELAGLDTAVDLLAVSNLVAALQPAEIVASPPALGDGWVDTAHGVLPVPAPAVLELLRGLPTAGSTGGAGELTTPTGAALLAELTTRFAGMPAGRIVGIGLGAGSRELADRPNVLRAILVDTSDMGACELGRTACDPDRSDCTGDAADSADDPHGGPVVMLECTIDDATAELLAHAAERLLAEGALDVWTTPAMMKKGRAGVELRVLCAAQARDRLASVIFRETTTFGLRTYAVDRIYAEQAWTTVRVAGSDIRVRLAYVDNRLVTASPEYEDCRTVAGRVATGFKEIYAAAQAAAWAAASDRP